MILNTEQLEAVNYLKNNYNIDLTKEWFTFYIEEEYAEDAGYEFFVCIQPEKGFDQDPCVDEFLPKSIENDLECLGEVSFGYNGSLSKEDFITKLEDTKFFIYGE